MTALNATTASKAPRRAVRPVSRRAVAVVAVAAGAALALSGCSAGQISQTSSQVSAVNGNTADIGKVALRNVRVLLPQSEQYTNAKGGKAVLAFTAINDSIEPDVLTSIETDLGAVAISPKNPQLQFQQALVADKPGAGSSAQLSGPAGSAAVTGSAHAEGTGGAEHPAPSANQILVEVDGLTKDVVAGLTYRMTFNFKNNGTVSLQVPVDAGTDTANQAGSAAGGSAGH